MISLSQYMGDQDDCYPSIDSIAADARLSPRQVINCLAELDALGEISITRGAGVRGRGGRTNLYRFPKMPPTKRALQRGAKIAPLSENLSHSIPPESHADSASLSTESYAESAPLPKMKEVKFPAERGEKSRLDFSPEPIRTLEPEEPELPPPTPSDGGGQAAALFDQIYQIYPKGYKRVQAFREFERLQPTAALVAEIIAGVEGYKSTAAWQTRPQVIPTLQTFLKHRRWLDCFPELPVDARGYIPSKPRRMEAR